MSSFSAGGRRPPDPPAPRPRPAPAPGGAACGVCAIERIWPSARIPEQIQTAYRSCRVTFISGLLTWIPLTVIPLKRLACHLACDWAPQTGGGFHRSEEHTSELQSHSFISYAV